MPIEVFPTFVGNHSGTVESAPNHKVPTGTMPESAKEHGDERIEVGIDFLAARGLEPSGEKNG